MKRGESGVCCVVGIDKPQGRSSHDVVNAVRHVFGERRVGHTGTLDPLATGALAVCVGPATRLDAYMSSDSKTYEARIAFGVATDTDDAQGTPLRSVPVPAKVYDRTFAETYIQKLKGPHRQMPPAYCAIKQGGIKGYEAARAGRELHLERRDIEIYEAELIDLEENTSSRAWWDVRLAVSKGTYIRSIARDIGEDLNSAAHVASLRRIRTGLLDVGSCVSLETLEERGIQAALDPVLMLGFPVTYLDANQAQDVSNGRTLALSSLNVEAVEAAPCRFGDSDCGESRNVYESKYPLSEGENISLVFENELRAIYTVFPLEDEARPSCVFSQGVIRGKDL